MSTLLILDCDGVLIRSEVANLAYYNCLFREFGLPEVRREDREPFLQLHTLSTPQVIDVFFPASMHEGVRRFADGLGFEPFVSLVEPEPGWGSVLDRWRAAGGVVAVATNRGTSASAVLSAVGLLSRVDHLVTIRDVARPKPHPDLLLQVLDQSGRQARCSLYVGDSELDREAAARANVPFLGFRLPGGEIANSAAEVELWLGRLASRECSATLLGAAT
ncbi:MAG TPA: HAD hydrolase-like protein [Deferrisomatales bacterium]|nr:HAD hydrolase-like protein [Deferrisomatales bacterium]